MIAWLKDNVWVVAWLFPPMTLLIAVVQILVQPKGGSIPKLFWLDVIVVLVVLTSIALAFTPGLDRDGRSFARTVSYVSLAYGMLRYARS
jgi:hypothetical protein